MQYISENLIINTDELARDCLINAAKIIGINGNFLANIVVDALLTVKYTDVRIQPLYPVSAFCHMEGTTAKFHPHSLSTAVP